MANFPEDYAKANNQEVELRENVRAKVFVEKMLLFSTPLFFL